MKKHTKEESISIIKNNKDTIVDFIKSTYTRYTKDGKNVGNRHFMVLFDLEKAVLHSVLIDDGNSRKAYDEQISDDLHNRVEKGLLVMIAFFPLGNIIEDNAAQAFNDSESEDEEQFLSWYKDNYVEIIDKEVPIIDRVISFYDV